MTRHSKNSTSRAFYSNAERAGLGWGYVVCLCLFIFYSNVSETLNGESQLPFGYCCLTLQPAKFPLASPEGWIFDRDAVVEYLAMERDELQRTLRRWEEDQKLRVSQLPDATAEMRKQWKASETCVVKRSFADISKASVVEAVAPRPDTVPKCPMSGVPLRFKELIPVHFEGDAEYCCAITKRPITHQKALLLKPSGVVVLEAAFKQAGDSSVCPISGLPLGPTDVIPLQSGGTGFSSHNKVQVKVNRHLPTRANEGGTKLLNLR